MKDRLTPMLTFVRIMDAGSLSAAARAMGRSLPAVSRSLAQLEQRLGVRLIQRTTRRLSLTDAGVQFYERCRRILAEIDEAEATAGAQRLEPQGSLVVTAPLLFGRMHVTSVVAEFLRRHPKISVHLLLTDRVANLVEEEIDVAVRTGKLADSSLIARRLGVIPRIVCASPDYLKRRGTPHTPEDLARHDCIRFTDLTQVRYWSFVDGERPIRIAVHGLFVTNNADAAINAAEHGLGLVMVLAYQVTALLAEGRLVRVLQSFELPPTPVNAVHASGRLAPAKLKAFLDLLAEIVAPRLAALNSARR
ncbi:MAG: LysR family transcriptional regulator [Betaproteobacteria bacterium]|nr:LysR family transcriptional regulator [Betaproteobacteria bacterium]